MEPPVPRTSPAVLLALSAISLAVFAPFAAAQTPSHPLSQITPTDSELNMSGNTDAQSYNITGLPGIVPSGTLSIYGDVDLGSNSLSSVSSITGYYGSECSSSEAVADVNDDGSFTCTSIVTETEDLYVNESGDAMSGTLDMQGNNITGLPTPVGSSNPVTLDYLGEEYVSRSGDSMTGNLDMQGNDLQNVNTVGNGTTALELDPVGDISMPNGNLDMAGNNITDIDYVNPGGSTLEVGGDVKADTGNLGSDTRMCIGDRCA